LEIVSDIILTLSQFPCPAENQNTSEGKADSARTGLDDSYCSPRLATAWAGKSDASTSGGQILQLKADHYALGRNQRSSVNSVMEMELWLGLSRYLRWVVFKSITGQGNLTPSTAM